MLVRFASCWLSMVAALGAFGERLYAQTPEPAAAEGKVWFVSPDGSDDAPGDRERPLKTFAKAQSAARPGDTIRLRAGRYGEKLAVRVSGAEGQPITIEGERGPGGEWLTELDPSVPIATRWVPAPEVAQGVYKMPFPGFEPHLMLVDGKFIPRIWPTFMQSGLGFAKLAYPPDQKVVVGRVDLPEAPGKGGLLAAYGREVDPTGQKTVNYWDLMRAMYGCQNGVVYIRFRDGDDPNKRAIRIAPRGGGVEIVGQSWIVLRDLFVQGGQSGVAIRGPNADHNIVERCRLVNASERISVIDASHTIVRNNDITADFYSDKCLTGAWGSSAQGDETPDELAMKNFFYLEYKHFFGPHTTSDYGIRLTGGKDNEIAGNRLGKGGQGINVSRTSDARVHGNTVEGMSSIGIIPMMDRLVNVQIHENLILDCNIALRIHHINEPRQSEPRSLYVYRNCVWQKPGVGTGIFFHYWEKNDVEPYPHPHIAIYHNTFAGGSSGLSHNAYVEKSGGLPNTLVANNILSNPRPISVSGAFLRLQGGWIFDYNWLGGAGKPDAVWYGSHNLDAKGQMIWNTAKAPDVALPADSPARHAGLDLARSFELGGKKFSALPGMDAGYFTGPRPDLGIGPPSGITLQK